MLEEAEKRDHRRIGTQLDSDIGPDATVLTLTALSRFLGPALGLLADLVVRPSLREDDFLRAEADWIWETDAAMRITHLAAEAGVEPGLDLAAMLGQPLTLLFALEADEDGALPILAAAAEQTRFDGQIAELRGTGQRVRISASPRIDAMGRFAGFSGSAVLVDPADEAGANAVADPEFTSEFGQRLEKALRTPLARIIANADSISAKLDGPLRDDYAEYATDISNAGRHLLSLVEDLADLSAIERDDFTVEIEPIDLADIARRAAGLLAVRILSIESVSLIKKTLAFQKKQKTRVKLMNKKIKF